jgi:hypothetical protein
MFWNVLALMYQVRLTLGDFLYPPDSELQEFQRLRSRLDGGCP